MFEHYPYVNTNRNLIRIAAMVGLGPGEQVMASARGRRHAHFKCFHLLILFRLLSSFARGKDGAGLQQISEAVHEDFDFHDCAPEGEYCACSGTVRFGHSIDVYAEKYITSGILCSDGLFLFYFELLASTGLIHFHV